MDLDLGLGHYTHMWTILNKIYTILKTIKNKRPSLSYGTVGDDKTSFKDRHLGGTVEGDSLE